MPVILRFGRLWEAVEASSTVFGQALSGRLVLLAADMGISGMTIGYCNPYFTRAKLQRPLSAEAGFREYHCEHSMWFSLTAAR
jgi:hypothetical protein